MRFGLYRLFVILVESVLMATPVATAGELAAQPKMPVPDADAQQTARKAAGELFADRFTQARTTAEKTALATDMMDAAGKVQAGSADQYVLLKIAREIAVGAGEAATALQAADEQAKRFDVPAAKLKAETLLAAAREAKATAQHKAVAEAAQQLVKDWTDASEIELSLSVCEAGRLAAQKARQFELVKELAAKADVLKTQRKAAQEYRQALAVMQADPVEPGANLTAGRYLCFVVGDWERGVPYLALGSDQGLKAVAIKELRGAASADEQAAIGDMWWTLAETKQGSERDALLLRAGAWYRQAEPQLTGGLAGLKVKQRLAEIAKLGREIPEFSGAAMTAPPGSPAVAPFDEKQAKGHQLRWSKQLKVPVEMANSIGMKFVLVPPGEFQMGSPPEHVRQIIADAKAQNLPDWYIQRLPCEAPRHRVRITKPFYLGMYEVTQEEYQRVTGTNPSYFAASGGLKDRVAGLDTRRFPAENTHWHSAVDFCRGLSDLPAEKEAGRRYRLPTEAEWEYACRAGSVTPYFFGDDVRRLGDYCWYSDNSAGRTQPVGQKRPNAWGLFDMGGERLGVVFRLVRCGLLRALPGRRPARSRFRRNPHHSRQHPRRTAVYLSFENAPRGLARSLCVEPRLPRGRDIGAIESLPLDSLASGASRPERRSISIPTLTCMVDLLVIMPTTNEVSQAVRIRVALAAPFPMDLLVRTPEKLRQRVEEGNWFLREITEQGKVLYASGSPPLGTQGRKRPAGRKTTRRRNATAP